MASVHDLVTALLVKVLIVLLFATQHAQNDWQQNVLACTYVLLLPMVGRGAHFQGHVISQSSILSTIAG